MIYYGYFIKRLPVEETITDLKTKLSKYPVECYFFKSGKGITYGKAYAYISTYYGATEGDIINVFDDD